MNRRSAGVTIALTLLGWACNSQTTPEPINNQQTAGTVVIAAEVDPEATARFVDKIENTKGIGITRDSRDRIVKLQIPGLDLNHDDFRGLGGLPFLHTILIGDTTFDDQDMSVLLNLPNLRQLGLKSTRITDEALRIVAQLPAIREVYLADTEIGNSGIAALKGKVGLELLGLRGTHVDTGAVESLSRIPDLITLVVDQGQISIDGLDRLERALPLLDIKLRVPATPNPEKEPDAP